MEKLRLRPSPVTESRSPRIGSDGDVRDIVLRGAESDREVAAGLRQEQLLLS